jgi:hypothetical protein
MSAPGNATFDIGRVASRTFAVIGRNWMAFLALSVLAVLPQMAWSYFTVQGTALGPTVILSGLYWLFLLGGWTVTIVASFVLQAALTYGAIRDLNGQPTTLGEALSVGLRAFVPLLAIGLLYTLGLGVALVLLIVPGLMLLTSWAVVVPACIVEGAGITQSFSRSSELTQGYRWPIFGLFVVFYLVVIVVDYAVRPMFGLALTARASSLAAAPLYFVLTGAIRVVTAVISSAGVACIYYELRSVKEGIGPEQLAAVFE